MNGAVDGLLVPTGYLDLPGPARHLVAVGHGVVAGCDDGSVVRIDDTSSTLLHRLKSPVTALASSTDRIVCGSLSGSVVIVNLTERQVEATFRHGAPITAAAYSSHAAVVTHDRWINVAHDGPAVPVDLRIGTTTALATVDGHLHIVGGTKGAAWFDAGMNVSDGRIDLPTIVAVTTDPQRRCVALGDLGGSIHVIRPGEDEGEELTGYPDRVNLLCWLASGAGLCAAADDELTMWTPTADGHVIGDQPESFVGHDAPITAMTAGPDELVATGDADGVVCVWAPLTSSAPLGRVFTRSVVLSLAWHGTRQRLAVGTAEGHVVRFDLLPT